MWGGYLKPIFLGNPRRGETLLRIYKYLGCHKHFWEGRKGRIGDNPPLPSPIPAASEGEEGWKLSEARRGHYCVPNPELCRAPH